LCINFRFVRLSDDENLLSLYRYWDILFSTNRNMADNFAKVFFLASHIFTRIDTVIIYASLLFSTIFITLAFTLGTFLSGVTKRSSGTCAFTFGIK